MMKEVGKDRGSAHHASKRKSSRQAKARHGRRSSAIITIEPRDTCPWCHWTMPTKTYICTNSRCPIGFVF